MIPYQKIRTFVITTMVVRYGRPFFTLCNSPNFGFIRYEKSPQVSGHDK